MGVIRPSDVVSGRVPTHRDFQLVASYIRKSIEHEPAFIGGMFGGSVALGHPTAFSDVDGAMLYKDYMEAAAFRRWAAIVSFAAKHHVPVRHFRIVPLSEASGNKHTITKSFRAHLEACAEDPRSIIKAPILQLFSEHPDSLEQNALDYISRKLIKMRQLVPYRELPEQGEWIELIEESLATPFYCALRTLEVVRQTATPVEHADRHEIWLSFRNYAYSTENKDLCTTQQTLYRLLKHRTKLLEDDLRQALIGEPEAYGRRLQQIADMSDTICQVVATLRRHVEETMVTRGVQQLPLSW